MKKLLLLVLSCGLLVVTALSGCEGSTCDKACGAADGCPSFAGSYDVTLTVAYDECSFNFVSGPATLDLTETPMDDKTMLNVDLYQGMMGGAEMIGEICNTSDTAFPKKYNFGADYYLTQENTTSQYAVGGDMIVFDGGAIEVCGALSYIQQEEEDRCSSRAIIFTSDICE